MTACTTPAPDATTTPAPPTSWQGSESASPVTLSERAADHIAKYIAKRGKGIGIRLGVRTSGCSGMGYTLEFAEAAHAEDIEFLSYGVKVLVDPKSLPYLAGTELDYAREGLNEGFKFNNPNVKDACGCGESFNT
jgi:iron-sulfur cluster assembly protein